MIIREVEAGDAAAVAKLSGELGYPVSTEAMRSRIQARYRFPDHVVYVACQSDVIVGWIDVGIVHHLQADPCGEIGGLVVSSEHRSSGIGRQLVGRAEQWVKDRGFSTMRVRSRISREAAHRFYERAGYEHTKTSAVFTKCLL